MPIGRRLQFLTKVARSRDARHALELGLARFLGPVGGLLANIAVARTLGAEGRGQIAAVLVLFSTLELILAFGAPDILARDIARNTLPLGSARTLSTYAATISVIPGIAVIFYCHHWGFSWATSVFIGVLVPATTVTYMARGVLLGQHQYRKLTISHLLFGMVKITAPLLLIAVDKPSVNLGLMVFLSGTVAAAIPILASRPFAGAAVPFRSIVPLLRESLIVWPTHSMWPLFTRADQLMLAAATSATELGRYAVCVAIADVSVALSAGPRQILMARAAKSGSVKELRKLAQLVPIIGLLGGLLCVAAAGPVMTFLFGPEFSGLSNVVAALVLASSFEIAVGILGGGLIVADKVKRLLMIQTVALIFLLLILFFVMSLGAGLRGEGTSDPNFIMLAAACARVAASSTAFFLSSSSLKRVL
jgi:O-antigen/teichoic acid export membrane protein